MLTQSEADYLMAVAKRLEESAMINFPAPGDKASWVASSVDKRDHFLMDVNRGRLRLRKCTYQNRFRQMEILIRVDLDGPPHRNPDGAVVHCPHIHRYREGYADKWADPLPADRFSDPTDLVQTFRDFLQFCNVQEVPQIQSSIQ